MVRHVVLPPKIIHAEHVMLDVRSYVPPVKIGETMRGAVIGKVIASKAQEYPVGTYATSLHAGWTELAVVKAAELEKIDVPRNGKVTDAMGVLGTAELPLTIRPFDLTLHRQV